MNSNDVIILKCYNYLTTENTNFNLLNLFYKVSHMLEFKLRKLIILNEEIFHENGPIPLSTRIRGAAIGIVSNPYAGSYNDDLQSGMESLKDLGLMLTDRLIASMGGADGIDGYGKAAIAGENGELEHTALWHVPGGYAMRQRLKNSKAIVPSAMKVAGMGASIDIPLGHTNAAYVRSHFDAYEVNVTDSPRANEIMFCLAMTKGPRIHSRMGGLEVNQVKGEDGLK
jgi:hypothetical protein